MLDISAWRNSEHSISIKSIRFDQIAGSSSAIRCSLCWFDVDLRFNTWLQKDWRMTSGSSCVTCLYDTTLVGLHKLQIKRLYVKGISSGLLSCKRCSKGINNQLFSDCSTSEWTKTSYSNYSVNSSWTSFLSRLMYKKTRSLKWDPCARICSSYLWWSSSDRCLTFLSVGAVIFPSATIY